MTEMTERQPPRGAASVRVRRTRPRDFERIGDISRRIYAQGWGPDLLASHLEVFPAGQLVAVDAEDRVVGMAASLIISWDDYDTGESWRDFTERGTFRNHDPENGRTLYGAEVMVDPEARRMGVGSALYRARRDLARSLGAWRIRAHSRLAGYHRHADGITAREYVQRVVRGELTDPTLTFQLGWGFRALAVVSGYLRADPESRGWAALIEWINVEVVPPEAIAGRPEI